MQFRSYFSLTSIMRKIPQQHVKITIFIKVSLLGWKKKCLFYLKNKELTPPMQNYMHFNFYANKYLVCIFNSYKALPGGRDGAAEMKQDAGWMCKLPDEWQRRKGSFFFPPTGIMKTAQIRYRTCAQGLLTSLVNNQNQPPPHLTLSEHSHLPCPEVFFVLYFKISRQKSFILWR